jgi:hypothetical protein
MPEEGAGGWFGPERAPEYTEEGRRGKYLRERGAEIINYSFSPDGASIFLRAFGIVGENQGLENIPELYSDIVERGTGNYRVVKDIEGLPGVRIVIHSYWSESLPAREQMIGIGLTPEFFKILIESKVEGGEN